MDTSLFGDDEADDERLDRVLGAADSLDLPTSADVDRVYPRLVPAGLATDEHGWGYATSTLPGTATVYVYDLPDIFYYLNSDRVAEHGADVLADAATHNLRTAELDEPEPLDDGVWGVTGAHAGASALILPEAIWRCTGETEFPDGVLFAAPTNGVLLYHVPRDAGIAAALENLALLAVTAFDNDERRRVTPAAFWWDGVDEVTQVSNVDPDTEQIDIYMSGEFEEMYSRLLTRPAD